MCKFIPSCIDGWSLIGDHSCSKVSQKEHKVGVMAVSSTTACGHTGCPEDHVFFHMHLISGIPGQIRLIFHMLNKQRLRFDILYRTLGLMAN